MLNTKTLHFAHTVYLCVPYGPHKNSGCFPSSINRLFFVAEMQFVSCEIRTELIYYSEGIQFLKVERLTYTLSGYMLNTKTLQSAHRVHLCVPYDPHNKQRLFLQTANWLGFVAGT
jgi:hypothetical protein